MMGSGGGEECALGITHVTSSRYWRSMSTSPRRFMKYRALRHMGELAVMDMMTRSMRCVDET